MGGASSNIKTTLEGLNQVLNEVSTKVVNENTSMTNDVNDLTFECDDSVYNTALDKCSHDQDSTREYLKEMGKSTGDWVSTEEMNKILENIPTCKACQFSGITQKINRTLEINDKTTNDITNTLQNELSSKLDAFIKQNTESGMATLAKSKVDTRMRLQNKIQNVINNEFINKTLRSYSAQNKLVVRNGSAFNVSQEVTSNILASAIYDNLISNDQTTKADLASFLKADQTTKAKDPISSLLGIFSGPFGIIFSIIAFIMIIFFGYMYFKRSSAVSSNNYMAYTGLPQMNLLQQYGMQRPQMNQPQMNQPQMNQPQMNQPQMNQPQQYGMQRPQMNQQAPEESNLSKVMSDPVMNPTAAKDLDIITNYDNNINLFKQIANTNLKQMANAATSQSNKFSSLAKAFMPLMKN